MKRFIKAVCFCIALTTIFVFSACQQRKDSEKSQSSTQSDSESYLSTYSDESVPEQSEKIQSEETTESQVSIDLSEFGELDDETLRKIKMLRKNMTRDEVHEILGDFDDSPPTGMYWEYYYINGNPNRWIKISFNDDALVILELGDSEKHKGVRIF